MTTSKKARRMKDAQWQRAYYTSSCTNADPGATGICLETFCSTPSGLVALINSILGSSDGQLNFIGSMQIKIQIQSAEDLLCCIPIIISTEGDITDHSGNLDHNIAIALASAINDQFSYLPLWTKQGWWSKLATDNTTGIIEKIVMVPNWLINMLNESNGQDDESKYIITFMTMGVDNIPIAFRFGLFMKYKVQAVSTIRAFH